MITALIIISLFVIPVIPGFFNAVPRITRYPLFAAMVLAGGMIVYWQHWSMIKLGIDQNNLLNGWQWYAGFTVLGLFYIFTLTKLLKLSAAQTWWQRPHFLFGFALMSIGQEFLYRGFLMPELKMIFSSAAAVILTNALLFTFIHSVFPNKLINITSAFFGGLGFAALYYFYPNLLLISLSHMALNFCAVYFGLFVFKKQVLVATP